LTLAIVLLTIGLIVAVAALALAALAGASPASPAPAATPSASPPPAPASSATVHSALANRRRAERARNALSRVRRCFGDSLPVRVSPAPRRLQSEAAWTRASRRWRAQANGWRAKTKEGIAKLRHPGGSGAARWVPAMRYAGWSEYGIRVMVPIVMRESSGSPHVWNHQGSGCYGLYQLAGCWWPCGAAWMSDPLNQCRTAWHIFHDVQHDSPYPAWSL
jgi:hypothetical protein